MKQKKEKPNKRLEKAATAYFDLCNTIGINDSMSKELKIKFLIKEGVKCLANRLNTDNDIIDIDFNEVSNNLDVHISKSQYKELVNIKSKIATNSFSDKNKEKFEESVKQKMYDQAIRDSFLNSIINCGDDQMQIPEFKSDIIINLENNDDEDFNKILDKSVERQINDWDVNRNMLDKLSCAFEYITELKYSKKDFNLLVSWEFYNGGVPTEKSAPKLFSSIYKFNETLRLGSDFEISELNDLLEEMGLEITVKEPMPRSEHFQYWSKDMIDKYCPFVKEDYYEWLRDNRSSKYE